MDRDPILAVDRLTVSYPGTDGEWRPVVEGVSLTLPQGGRLALVGESGSGKSVTALACLGLVQPPGRRTGGRVVVAGVDLESASPRQLRQIRGGAAALVFQEPTSSLNPVYTVGFQIAETIRSHRPLGRAEARVEAGRLLADVALGDVGRIAGSYPHQLSGGQLQRVLIALALAGEPELLIADEPTSALDLLTQAEILDLLARLTSDKGVALLLVSHDLAMVEESVDRVAVMYAGRVVEEAAAGDLFRDPLHPYSRELLAASGGAEGSRSIAAPASADGCRFAPRCGLVAASCREEEPDLVAVGSGRLLRCPVVTGGAPSRRRSGGG